MIISSESDPYRFVEGLDESLPEVHFKVDSSFPQGLDTVAAHLDAPLSFHFHRHRCYAVAHDSAGTMRQS